MAAKKRSTLRTPSKSDAAEARLLNAPVSLPADPAAVRKLAELGVKAGRLLEIRVKAADAAEANAAACDAVMHRQSYPLEYLRNDDLTAIESRLTEAAFALLAMHRLAVDGQEDDTGMYLRSIQELARSTFKGLDACIERMSGGPGIGNFAGEFEQ